MIRKMFISLAAAVALAGQAFVTAAHALREATVSFAAWAWAVVVSPFASTATLVAQRVPALASVAYADPAPIRAYESRRLQREPSHARQRTPSRLAV